jgi:hypothetical protein
MPKDEDTNLQNAGFFKLEDHSQDPRLGKPGAFHKAQQCLTAYNAFNSALKADA